MALLGWLTPAFATKYYVDPTTGKNTNDGLSPGTAWMNPPGTRTTSDSGFFSTTWGAITTDQANKIQCGDTILLRGGATQTSAQGGAWRIDNGPNMDGTGYYRSDCAGKAAITIRVATATEWGDLNATGNFTLDGTGVQATCLVFYCQSGGTHGLLFINDISNLVFGGNSASQRLVIQHAAATGYPAHNLLVASSHNSTPPAYITQFEGQWLESAFAQNDGVAVGFATNFVIHDTISHDNGTSGFSTGFLYDDRVTNGAFVDVEAYYNGSKGVIYNSSNQAVNTGWGDQFLFTGCESCYLIRANSHHAYLRGLNFGQINASWNMFLLIRDSQFWHNGILIDPNTDDPNQPSAYVYKSGPCWSGDDRVGAPYQFGVMERSIIAYNRAAGGPCAYGQGWASVWNSVWWHNGWDTSLWGRGDIAVAQAVDVNYFGVFNSIVQKRSSGSNYPITWTYQAPSGFGTKRCPVSDYNLFVPFTDNSETLSNFECVRTNGYSVATRTYTNPPAFIGPNTLVGSKYQANFCNTTDGSTSSTVDPAYSQDDFHLCSQNSSAIDKGTFMFKAVSGNSCSGAGSCTIQVQGNSVSNDPTGGSNDPTHYFISSYSSDPSHSYYKAEGDKIQIQDCGLGTIMKMTPPSRTTPGTITFTPQDPSPCTSWQAGKGIHFPWNGTAPDMGVYEY